MKTNPETNEVPENAVDRLMDALLREHARAGTGEDEGFLTRLSASLDATETPRPVESGTIHQSIRLAWPLGVAAALALAGGLIWHNQSGSPARQPEASASLAPVRADQSPLRTELPPELIEGTPPRPITLPDLVPAPTEAPEFYVPQGTRLLSRGKPVTSSETNPIIGSLDLVTDGDKNAGEGYFVELLDGLQWVQIDLGESAAIHAVWLWHFHSQRRAYHDVIVQVSDDPAFKTGVATLYNNDYDNSAGMGRGRDRPYVETRFGMIIDGKGTKGRHVRLYSSGNTSNEMNHYIEVEVFGLAD